MLNEIIKSTRESMGLSQEELAVRLNVVRQTVSKWERGLSVPDSDMLVALSDALKTPVSVLLGESVTESKVDSLRVIAEKLEVINVQLARRKETRRKIAQGAFVGLCVVTVLVFALIAFGQSPYLAWDFTDPETAVAGTALHAFEWVFVRLAPFVLIGSIAGICLTRKRS